MSQDAPAVLAFITNTLRSAGYRVFQAYDGFSALELALLLPSRLLVVNSPYAGGSLSDRLQMLAFEAELAHLPRSLSQADASSRLINSGNAQHGVSA